MRKIYAIFSEIGDRAIDNVEYSSYDDAYCAVYELGIDVDDPNWYICEAIWVADVLEPDPYVMQYGAAAIPSVEEQLDVYGVCIAVAPNVTAQEFADEYRKL